MGYIDGESIRHAYTGLIDRCIAITTPRILPGIYDFDTQQTVWQILKSVTCRGFVVKYQYPAAHICGQAPSCPTTIRSTFDSGWLNIPLPSVHFGTRWNKVQASWTLFGTGCKRGILEGARIEYSAAHEGDVS
jgi:hypothetical protein